MAYLKLNWSRKSAAQKMVRADHIVQQMTSNIATFPHPIPALAAIDIGITNLRDAATIAQGGGTANTMDKNKKEKVLDRMITDLSGYVKAVCSGDGGKMLQAGFEIRKTPSRTPDPVQVENLRAVPSLKSGIIKLNWDSMEYAKAYQVEQWLEPVAPNETGRWVKIDVSTKSKMAVENLETAKVHKFRVAAIGTGQRMGPYSQDASCLAL